MSYAYKPNFWNMPNQQQPRYQKVRFHTNTRLCQLRGDAPVGNSYDTMEGCVQANAATNYCGHTTYGCGDSGCYVSSTSSDTKEMCHSKCTQEWGWKCGTNGPVIDADSKVLKADLRCFGCANKDTNKASNTADMGPDGSCTYMPNTAGVDSLNYKSEVDCKNSEVTKCGWQYSCAS